MTPAIEQSFRDWDFFKGRIAVGLASAILLWMTAPAAIELYGSMRGPGWRVNAANDIAVSVSHPQLTSPLGGTELKMGPIRFEGVAEPGTEAVLFGDGAELGSGIADRGGKFSFVGLIDDPVPARLSISYYGGSGEPLGMSETIDLLLHGSNQPEESGFKIQRPVEKGMVKLGKVVFAGTGKPGSRVKLQVDRFQLGTVDVMQDGTWKLERTMNGIGVKRQIVAREIGGYNDAILAHTILVVE